LLGLMLVSALMVGVSLSLNCISVARLY
jgi:hypothetical protein